MESKALQLLLSNDFSLTEEAFLSREMLLKRLASHIDSMLQQNQERLFQLLYRLDVDEKRVVTILKAGGECTSSELAELMLQRYEQTLASRREHGARHNSTDDLMDDLRW